MAKLRHGFVEHPMRQHIKVLKDMGDPAKGPRRGRPFEVHDHMHPGEEGPGDNEVGNSLRLRTTVL